MSISETIFSVFRGINEMTKSIIDAKFQKTDSIEPRRSGGGGLVGDAVGVLG